MTPFTLHDLYTSSAVSGYKNCSSPNLLQSCRQPGRLSGAQMSAGGAVLLDVFAFEQLYKLVRSIPSSRAI